MRTFLIFFCFLSIIACKKKDTTQDLLPEIFDVRYDVEWNHYLAGSIYYISIYYRIEDSVYSDYYISITGNWFKEFKANRNDTLYLTFKGFQSTFPPPSQNLLKISVNNQTVISGGDSLSYIIK